MKRSEFRDAMREYAAAERRAGQYLQPDEVDAAEDRVRETEAVLLAVFDRLTAEVAARRPKFHYVYSDDYAFCCQSVRVPLAEFAAECIREPLEDADRAETAAEIAAQAVCISIAIRRSGHMEDDPEVWPAAPGDRGSFVAWAWPPPEPVVVGATWSWASTSASGSRSS